MPCVIGRDDVRHIRRGVKYPATGVAVSGGRKLDGPLEHTEEDERGIHRESTTGGTGAYNQTDARCSTF